MAHLNGLIALISSALLSSLSIPRTQTGSFVASLRSVLSIIAIEIHWKQDFHFQAFLGIVWQFVVHFPMVNLNKLLLDIACFFRKCNISTTNSFISSSLKISYCFFNSET